MNFMVLALRGISGKRLWAVVLAAGLLSSCNVTKFLADDQELLTDQSVRLSRDKEVQDRADVVYELSTLARQQPNGNFLFVFPREHFFLANSKPKDTTRIDRFLRNSIGQPPTIFSDSLSRVSAQEMADYMRYQGYFNATAYHEADRRGRRKVDLIYHVDPGQRFVIDSVTFSAPDPDLDSILQAIKPESELQPGAPLDLNRFDLEKNRIARHLNNEGYAFFSSAYFDQLEIDTTVGPGRANVYFNILPPPQSGAYARYRIGEVSVATDFDLTDPGSTQLVTDTVVNGIRFRSGNSDFRVRPDILADNIYLSPGGMSSRDAFERTNVSLGGLGIYRFVRISRQVDSSDARTLDYLIQLSPDKKMSFGVDLDLNYTDRSQSITAGNLIGISIGPTFRNRNVFGGAELLTTSLRAGVELNPSVNNNDARFFNTIDLGADVSLNLPRFKDFGLYRGLRGLGLISRGFYDQLRERASTRYSLAYEYLLIRAFYSYTIANARLGYNFRRSSTTTYRIDNFALDILNPTIEPLFAQILEDNERLRLSFDDQFFLSLLFREIDFTRVGRTDRRGRAVTLNGQFEISGAELFLAERAFGNTFRNNLFAQYALAIGDVRYYKQFSPLAGFATRLVVAGARPLTSGRVVPYVKQFFAGGANSMRAWAPRGLGPGGYIDTLSLNNDNSTNLRLFQTGDLRLELNLEYRFNLVNFFRGAFFLDIGNVWTLDEDPERPGSQFLFSGKLRTTARGEPFFHQPFYRQIAIAGGTGLRVDLSYFIFRLDAAIPLRYNYPADAQGDNLPRDGTRPAERLYWNRFDSFGLGDVTFQLGLGYPF